jgi:hypothetical protein
MTMKARRMMKLDTPTYSMPRDNRVPFQPITQMKRSAKTPYAVHVESSRPIMTRDQQRTAVPRFKRVLCSVLAWNTNLRC